MLNKVVAFQPVARLPFAIVIYECEGFIIFAGASITRLCASDANSDTLGIRLIAVLVLPGMIAFEPIAAVMRSPLIDKPEVAVVLTAYNR